MSNKVRIDWLRNRIKEGKFLIRMSRADCPMQIIDGTWKDASDFRQSSLKSGMAHAYKEQDGIITLIIAGDYYKLKLKGE